MTLHISDSLVPATKRLCGECMKHGKPCETDEKGNVSGCSLYVYKSREDYEAACLPLQTCCEDFEPYPPIIVRYIPGGVTRKMIVEQVLLDDRYAFCVNDLEQDKIYYNPILWEGGKVIYTVNPPSWRVPPRPQPYGTVEDLWEIVSRYIYRYVDLPSEDQYHILTGWILKNWVLELFNAVPYICFLGPKGSGKTRATEILILLSHRGWMVVGPSVPSIFRCIERWHITNGVDESEIWLQANKEEAVSYINSGYRRGIKTVRMEKIGDRIEPALFDVFGDKVFNSTMEHRDTLMDRSLLFTMTFMNRPVPSRLDENAFKEAEELRGKLLQFRFDLLSSAIKPVSEKSENPLVSYYEAWKGCKKAEEELQKEGIIGRMQEKILPIYYIAPQKIKPIILRYAKEQMSLEAEEEKAGIEGIVLSAVLMCPTYPTIVGYKMVKTIDVVTLINTAFPDSEPIQSKTVSYVLKRLGFTRTRIHKGKGYMFTPELVDRLKPRYKIINLPSHSQGGDSIGFSDFSDTGATQNRQRKEFEEFGIGTEAPSMCERRPEPKHEPRLFISEKLLEEEPCS